MSAGVSTGMKAGKTSGMTRALALVAATLLAPSAWGATTCSANITSLTFSPVTMMSASTTLTGSYTITCSSNAWLLSGYVRVRFCLNIGAGSGGAGPGLAPRQLRNANNEIMSLDLTRDAGYTQLAGSDQVPSTVPLSGGLYFTPPGYTTPSLDFHARIPAQPMLAVGTYQSTFSGLDAQLVYRYDESLFSTEPANCRDGGGGVGPLTSQTSFSATATVPPECHISVGDILDFGQFAGLPGPAVTATAAIDLICRRGTAWRLSLGDGLHAQGATRRMSNGSGAYAPYELYRDAAMTQRFGQTVNVDQLAGTGTGSNQSVTVYGRVPAAQSLIPGSYSDQVVVTVTY